MGNYNIRPIQHTYSSVVRTNWQGMSYVGLRDRKPGIKGIISKGIGLVDRAAAFIAPRGTRLAAMRLKINGYAGEEIAGILDGAFFLNRQADIETYQARKAVFLKTAEMIKQAGFKGVEIKSIVINEQEGLSVDSLYVPPQDLKEGEQPKLIVVTAGTHGMEGFRGNDDLIYVMQDILARNGAGMIDLSKTGVLFVHAVNPEGFNDQRRVDRDNIDYNRAAREPGKIDNPQYEMINEDINPREEVGPKNRNIVWVFREVIRRIGRPSIKKAILAGQTHNERGVFCGGTAGLPAGLEAALSVIEEKIKEFSLVLAFDIHTGFGRKKLCLVKPTTEQDNDIFAGVFEGLRLSETKEHDEGGFYYAEGLFLDRLYIDKEAEQTIVSVYGEYGTLGTEGLFGIIGQLRSLRALVRENQGHFYGYEDEKAEAGIKMVFGKLFYPKSLLWHTRMNFYRRTLRTIFGRFSSTDV